MHVLGVKKSASLGMGRAGRRRRWMRAPEAGRGELLDGGELPQERRVGRRDGNGIRRARGVE